MNFNSPSYLPDSEQRLENLRRIINGRPVAILAAGPSIKELEERIEELRHADICYFGMNSFWVSENNILEKINKHFSVVSLGPNIHMHKLFNNIPKFLDRSENNLYVSSHYNDGFEETLEKEPDLKFNRKKFFDKYDKKLLFLGFDADKTLPDNNRPLHFLPSNSLAVLIYLAIIGKASKIIFFGGDGHAPKNAETVFYRSNEYIHTNMPNEVLINNTHKYFNPGIPVVTRNIYRTYSIKPIPILNCSEASFYTPVPKISYNDAFDVLLEKKKAEEVSDLRIPTASIIIPHSGNEEELQDTLKNISGQSYTNYETIPVQRSPDFLTTLKNGLTLARGKYIFYCPAGDGYWHHNWINSCLEVLENDPKLSLVWGLSQDLLPDSAPGHIGQSYLFNKLPLQGKRHIYYWLKKKNFFPPNALCVRKEVLEKCMFSADSKKTDTEFANWLNFSLRFNSLGYLPAFISETATYSKYRDDNQGKNNIDLLNVYKNNIDEYKHQLIFRRSLHQFRDSDNNILPGKFYLSVFLFYDLAKKVKNNLPRPLQIYLYGLKNKVKKIVKTRLA